MPNKTPGKTIERLSLYRRLLTDLLASKTDNVYSHQLATAAGVTAAQVRRDIMSVGYSGSPTRGYDVQELARSVGHFLDASSPQSVALVGVGNLGRALLAYFQGRRPSLEIVAAFDSDREKTGRVINGCRCYSMTKLSRIVEEQGIEVAILAVPVSVAQEVANMLAASGIKGILNFVPIHLHVPVSVYVEDVDITTSLEKVAFFARR